jgi:iron complex outermembrane receptor protein
MMSSEGILIGCVALAFSSGCAIATAAERSAGERQGDGSAVTELQEVVVTATRRATLLEQTPVAITAFSGGALDREHLEDLGNIAIVAPSLVFTALSRQESYPSIRGTSVGNDAPGSDLGVTVFIDDIPTTGVGDNDPNLFDLQSIEVLRGPQGTLFGRNSTGGALVIHTLQPDFTTHEKAELTYGNYNLFEGRGYVTGPLVDGKLAGKVTFDVRRQDGIMDNKFLNTKTLSTSLWGTRAQLLWTPTEDLRVLIGADFSRDTSPYKVQQLIGNFQPALFPPLSYGPNDTEQAINSTGNSQSSGGFVRADYTGPLGTLTSITGYRHADSRDFFSTSADPFNEILQHYRVGADQLTEEIHLASNTGERFDWVTGLFFLNSQREGLKVYSLNVQPGATVANVDPYSALQFISNDLQHVHAHSYAVFGEANYSFATAWKLTLGARFTKEDKAGHSEKNDTSGLSPDLAAAYSHSWNAFNPKATLSYLPNKRLLAYATVASGFKSGGFDTSATTNEGLATPFRPERVTSYELGVKYTSPEDGFVINASGYYAKYKDLQVQEFRNLQYVTANAGVANIPGAEVEALFNPVSWLTFSGNYSYMNARYTRYVQGDGADFTGNQIPFDVKYHYTVGANAHFASPQPVRGRVELGFDLTWQGKRYFENENNDYRFITDRTRIRGLLNLHANWTSPGEIWQVSLWGNNVNNRRYIINATELTAFYASIPEFLAADAAGAPINRMYVGDWNPPRMFGISLIYKH